MHANPRNEDCWDVAQSSFEDNQKLMNVLRPWGRQLHRTWGTSGMHEIARSQSDLAAQPRSRGWSRCGCPRVRSSCTSTRIHALLTAVLGARAGELRRGGLGPQPALSWSVAAWLGWAHAPVLICDAEEASGAPRALGTRNTTCLQLPGARGAHSRAAGGQSCGRTELVRTSLHPRGLQKVPCPLPTLCLAPREERWTAARRS